MQKVLIGCMATPARATLVAQYWLRAPGMGFHHKTEIVRDSRGIAGIIVGGYGSVKCAIETDRTQQGVMGVGRQTMPGQDTGRGGAIVYESLPAWEGP